ncbi:TonB family protein [Mucilaginibacter sp.]|jgi:TonB family protein|uniref:TonB family protein n=1 Tax=Mucilaginibacter sp. TaxID=1882438 RepID=UPI00356852CA
MTWWHYLLLVNIYLVLFFGFYTLLLRRETFFQLNRIYLVGAVLLSFFIPLIQAQWVKDLFITKRVQTIYSTTAPDMIVSFTPIKDNPVTIGEMLITLYIIGAVVLAARLIYHLVLLKRMINQPTSAAYSFFKRIKLTADIPGRDVIIKHEEVHAQQWHSADVLIIEAVMIINWFNPVVYLYRLAIKHIHEFIADRQALKAGTNKADYALLLLSQTFNSPVHHLVNPFFNHSLLKQRIMMLQKSNSQRIKLAKYGLSAPLFILMLILSSATISNSKAVKVINNKAEEVFLQPATSVIPDEEPEMVQHKAELEIITPEGTKAKATDHVLPGSADNGKNIDTVPNKKVVFTQVEHSPGFPGGDKAFSQFLSKNIRYPKKARENNVQGRVIATFIVEPDGKLTDIKILRGIGSGADEESVRVLKKSPKWEPGIQNGRKVRVQYSVPIQFSLTETTITYTPPKNNEKAPEVSYKGTDDNKNQIFTAVELSPTFPGGNAAFQGYLAKNVRYPARARENKTQGRVIVAFVVEMDGSITNAHVIRGIGDGADEEAVRVINASPKWIAGVQNGRKVRVTYTVPIQFSLAQAENKTGAVPATKTTQDKQKFTFTSPSDSSKQSVRLTGIRGINDPLYIVDGKEVESINTIDPKGIESISVLKDAAATSLYGVKALNGVILVTLKKAKAKN